LTFSPAWANADGHVNFFLEQKSLDDFWSPSLDKQLEFGAVMSFGQDDWPVHIAVDVLASANETTVSDPSIGSVTATGSTFEIDEGVRNICRHGRVLPYVGGGVGVIGAALMGVNGFVSEEVADAGFALWADTGVFFRLGTHVSLGLDVRYYNANVGLDLGSGIVARSVNAAGLHYGLVLGFGW